MENSKEAEKTQVDAFGRILFSICGNVGTSIEALTTTAAHALFPSRELMATNLPNYLATRLLRHANYRESPTSEEANVFSRI